MNKKQKHSTEYYLLDWSTKRDKNLSVMDKNILSVLGFLSNSFGLEFFRSREKLLEDLEGSEVCISKDSLKRSLVKLDKFGYIKYTPGGRPKNGSAKVSEFKLLKGVITISESKKSSNNAPLIRDAFKEINITGSESDKSLYNAPPNTNTNTKTNITVSTGINTSNTQTEVLIPNVHNVSLIIDSTDKPEKINKSNEIEVEYLNTVPMINNEEKIPMVSTTQEGCVETNPDGCSESKYDLAIRKFSTMTWEEFQSKHNNFLKQVKSGSMSYDDCQQYNRAFLELLPDKLPDNPKYRNYTDGYISRWNTQFLESVPKDKMPYIPISQADIEETVKLLIGKGYTRHDVHEAINNYMLNHCDELGMEYTYRMQHSVQISTNYWYSRFSEDPSDYMVLSTTTTQQIESYQENVF